MSPPAASREPLAAGLYHAAEWFNGALLTRLADAGWPPLSRRQSEIFPLLATDGPTHQADIARRLGVTRQSANALLRQLVELGVLEQRTDPDDGRRVLVHLTPRGARLAAEARRILTELEGELGARIGDGRVAALRDTLGRVRAATTTDPGG